MNQNLTKTSIQLRASQNLKQKLAKALALSNFKLSERYRSQFTTRIHIKFLENFKHVYQSHLPSTFKDILNSGCDWYNAGFDVVYLLVELTYKLDVLQPGDDSSYIAHLKSIYILFE